jgi:hypothetical protein
MWATGFYSSAYFMAGRDEDALKMLEHKSPENYGKWGWVLRGGSLAAVGRTEEASASVRETLELYPDLTVEGWVNELGLSKTERGRFIEAMTLAGFPLCAISEALAKLATPVRLPECGSR